MRTACAQAGIIMVKQDTSDNPGASGLTKNKRKHAQQSTGTSGNSVTTDSADHLAAGGSTKRKRKSLEQTPARGKSASPEHTAEQILNQSSAARILQELPRYNWLEQKILQRNSYPTPSRSTSVSSSSSSASIPTYTTAVVTSTTTLSLASASLLQTSGCSESTSISPKVKNSSSRSISPTVTQTINSYNSYNQSCSVGKPPISLLTNNASRDDLVSLNKSSFTPGIQSHPLSHNKRALTASVTELPCGSHGAKTIGEQPNSSTRCGTDHLSVVSLTDHRVGWNSISTPVANSSLTSVDQRLTLGSQYYLQISPPLSGVFVTLPQRTYVNHGYGTDTFVDTMSTMVTATGLTAPSSTAEGVVSNGSIINTSRGSSAELLTVQTGEPFEASQVPSEEQPSSPDDDVAHENGLTIDLSSPAPEPDPPDIVMLQEECNPGHVSSECTGQDSSQVVETVEDDTNSSVGRTDDVEGDDNPKHRASRIPSMETCSKPENVSLQSSRPTSMAYEQQKTAACDRDTHIKHESSNETLMREKQAFSDLSPQMLNQEQLETDCNTLAIATSLQSTDVPSTCKAVGSPIRSERLGGSKATPNSSVLDFSSAALSSPESNKPYIETSTTTTSQSNPGSPNAKTDQEMDCNKSVNTRVMPKNDISSTSNIPELNQKSSPMEETSETSDVQMKTPKLRHEECHKVLEKVTDSTGHNEASPLDLCVKKTECPISGPSVSRNRGPLPVQMVLPQVQTPISPPAVMVAPPGPNVVISPPAHTKSLHSLSTLNYGIEERLYPMSHHRYRGLHPCLLDIKVTSPPDLESFKATSLGETNHSISAFKAPSERHHYQNRIHSGSALAIGGPQDTVPTVYMSDPNTPTSLSNTPVETATSASENSPGGNAPDNFIGVTSPYLAPSASSLAISDAELEQEFQQHLLEFKALEKLAERKAREQMHVAIMRKRKAEMLRAMEIKKAKRDKMLKGKTPDFSSDVKPSVSDSRITELNINASGSSSVNSLPVPSDCELRHADTSLPVSKSPLGQMPSSHEVSTIVNFTHNIFKASHHSDRTQTTSSTWASGTKGHSVSVRTSGGRVASGENNPRLNVMIPKSDLPRKDYTNADDLIPLNLTSCKGIPVQSFPVSCDVSLPVISTCRNVAQNMSPSPAGPNALPSMSIPTTFTTTVTTATTSNLTAIAPSGLFSTPSTSSEVDTSSNKLLTVSPPVSVSQTSVSAKECSSANSTVDVQCDAEANSSVKSTKLHGSERPKINQALSHKTEDSSSSSMPLADITTLLPSQSTCRPSVDNNEDSTSTNCYTLELKKEIIEDDSVDYKIDSPPPPLTIVGSCASEDSPTSESTDCEAPVEIKMEIVEEEHTDPCENPDTHISSGHVMEEDKDEKPVIHEENSEVVCANKNVSLVSKEDENQGVSIVAMDRTNPDEESQKALDLAEAQPEIISLNEIKVEIPKKGFDFQCTEPKQMSDCGTGSSENTPTNIGIDTKRCVNSETGKEAREENLDLSDMKPAELWHDTDSVKDSEGEPGVKPEVDATEIEQSKTLLAMSPPVTAHQAPTYIGPMEFDLDLPGDRVSRTTSVAGAYHRREVAVLEPPFQVTVENSIMPGGSPLPAHNQKPFQAAGSLIVLGAKNISAPPTPLPCYKLNRSKSNISPTASSNKNDQLITQLTYMSNTRASYLGQIATNGNETVGQTDREVKSGPPVMRRRSFDLSESTVHRKALSISGGEQGLRHFGPDQFSVGLSASSNCFAPSRETSNTLSSHASPQLQNHTPNSSLEVLIRNNRHTDNIPMVSDISRNALSNSSKTELTKSGVGSKRSAFKSLAKKRPLNFSALDLSVPSESSPPVKSTPLSRHQCSSNLHQQRHRVPLPQGGLDVDSVSLQEKLHNQVHRPGSGVGSGAHYTNRHVVLNYNTPNSFMLYSSQTTAPHYHPAEMSIAPSKSLPSTFNSDRVRPENFPTIHPRNLSLEATHGISPAPISKLQEHVRPSMSSVAQHRLTYQKSETITPASDQLSALPMVINNPSTGSSIGYSKGPVYEGQSESGSNTSSGYSKTIPPRPSPHISEDLPYRSIQQGAQGPLGQPLGYPYQLGLSETMSEKFQNPSHPAVGYRTPRTGIPSAQAEASMQRHREMMHKQKQEYPRQQGSSFPTGYLVPPATTGMLAAPYVLAPKQGNVPGSQNLIPGTVPGDQRRSGDPGAARHPDFRSQPQSSQNVSARSQIPNEQQLHHQHQIQQEKQVRQQSDYQQHTQQQFGRDSGLVRPVSLQQQQLLLHQDGPHLSGLPLKVGSPYGPRQSTPSFINAYHDTHQTRRPQPAQPHLQQHQISSRSGQSGPSPHQNKSMATPPVNRSTSYQLGYMTNMPANQGLAPPQILPGDISRQTGYPRIPSSGNSPTVPQERALSSIQQGSMPMPYSPIHNSSHGLASAEMQKQRYSRNQPLYEQRLSPQYPQQQHVQHQHQHTPQQQQQLPPSLPGNRPTPFPPSNQYQTQGATHQAQPGMRCTGSGSAPARGGIDQSTSASRGDQVVGNNVCHVCGKMALFLCSSCRNVWYCNHQCQTRHWATHAPYCKAEARAKEKDYRS